MALGGLAAAREVIGVARDAGIRVTVTALLDAAGGRAGALHLAASLGDDGDHGLATGSALAEDIVEEIADRPGYVPLPIGEGLGAALRERAAARTEPIAADVST
jgi:L-alanine-DL-glutamate epimerase-like enolase superfamily enzyme